MKSKFSERFLEKTMTFSGVIALTVAMIPLSEAQAVQPQLRNRVSSTQAETIAQQRILYVNPQQGTDTASSGQSEAAAFRTITYALQQAQSGTVIQLAAGQYSTETFPIQLKPGVILKGNEAQQGQGVVITGGGIYASRTFANQNVTVLAAQNSQVLGVTITNPNTRGSGIWVESTNPIIRNSTFTNSNREGIFITGQGEPRIENNQFINNGGNGISVARQAKGEIRGNVFQQTGVALAIGGAATPIVADNQIRNNRDGVVITETARPMLQGNVIENNSEYGIVVIGQAQPSIGSNTLRSNGTDQLIASGRQGTAPIPSEVASTPIPSASVTQAGSGTTATFLCVAQGTGFATIAQRGNATIPQPMINWNRTNLGADMTPEKRCQAVTQRLNQQVSQNGGNLDNLLFTVGPVNNSMAVCLVSETQPGCSTSNMIFTLSPENAKKPGEVLRRLVTFSVTGSGSPVQESVSKPYAPLKPLNQKLQPSDGLWFVSSQGQ